MAEPPYPWISRELRAGRVIPFLGQRGAFFVYIAWGDILSAVSEVTQRTQPFTIADVQQAKNGKFGYEFEVSKDYGLQRVELPRAVAQ